jgi:hypothetical protein
MARDLHAKPHARRGRGRVSAVRGPVQARFGPTLFIIFSFFFFLIA